jgi:hypothetical protein
MTGIFIPEASLLVPARAQSKAREKPAESLFRFSSI